MGHETEKISAQWDAIRLEEKALTSLQDETVLVTGGAGSLGSALTRQVLDRGARTVRVLDTDEHGLFKLRRSLEFDTQRKRLRLLLGDIRDYGRVRMAMQGVDVVYHTAAIKNLEISEYNPIEACRTNIAGTSTLVEAALEARPSKFIFLSSDKAVHHSTLYGASKFCGERIVLWANNVNEYTRFSVVRPPNFRTSRGNVFEVWKEELDKGKPLSITDPEMKRFFIETEVMASEIIRISGLMQGGEIFIPQNGVVREKILELAQKASLNIQIIGKRPGEKLEERLFTDDERHLLKEENGLLVIRAS